MRMCFRLTAKNIAVVIGMSLTLILPAGCQESRRDPISYKHSRDLSAIPAKVETKGTADTSESELGGDLQGYLRYAALHNPGLEAAFNRWKAELERISQVAAFDDPQFTYSYFIREVETRVGPQRQKIGIRQKFPWFDKLQLRGETAQAAAQAARYAYEAAKLKLFYQVKRGYYEYYYLAKAVEITRENLKFLQAMEETARAKYSSGTIGQFALLRFQVEIGKLEDRLVSLQEMRKPISQELRSAINLPDPKLLPWPDQVEFLQVELRDEELWEKVLQGPDLSQLAALIEKADRQVELSQKNYYPDITAGLDVIKTDRAMMSVADSGKDPVVFSLGLNLPLIQADKYRAAEREARLRRLAAKKQKNQRKNELKARLERIVYDVRNAQRKIDLYQKGLIPKAKQSFQVTQQAFAADRADFLDVIDAIRTLLDFQLTHERAIVDYAVGVANLEMLAPEQIPPARSREN
ncbi:MAG: TolC family protein [Planctomycetes bacterium]|nr:TolC family protein [Planctomycetota bacterium]